VSRVVAVQLPGLFWFSCSVVVSVRIEWSNVLMPVGFF